MMCSIPLSRRQRGVSLVEILVALTIQAILLLAVAQFFGVSSRVLRTQSEVADIQESGRFAANLLTADIRSAGYAGCRHLAELNPNIIADDFSNLDSVDDGIQVLNNGSGWTAPTGFTAVGGSDVIVIRYAGPSARVAERMTADNANIKIENNPDGIEANDVVLVTDCVKSDIFRATSVSNNSGNGNSSVTMAHANNANSTNRLSKVYDTNAFVYAMRQSTYFVGSDGTTTGLYRQAKDTADPVLISNDVSLLSAMVEEDGVNFVIGVRYGLLLATADGVATESSPFVFEGVTLNGSSGDTRLRKSIVGFANIRNNSP